MVKCNKLEVPTDCCYILFGKRANYKNSQELGMTIRGEAISVDFDDKGQIIGFELLGSKKATKPCQEAPHG
jgi:uncharacterized protein YuzE